MTAAETPALEYSMLPLTDLELLASSGNHHAQEMLAHKILKDTRVTPQSLVMAEEWASKAISGGHQLSSLTIAQICAGRAIVCGETGRDEAAIEHLAQAIAMFDELANRGETYSMLAVECLLKGLWIECPQAVQDAVLQRAKEMQAA